MKIHQFPCYVLCIDFPPAINGFCQPFLLFQRKIELEPRDKNGKTPLMLARSHRHDDIVSLLTTQIKKKNSWFPPIRDLW